MPQAEGQGRCSRIIADMREVAYTSAVRRGAERIGLCATAQQREALSVPTMETESAERKGQRSSSSSPSSWNAS